MNSIPSISPSRRVGVFVVIMALLVGAGVTWYVASLDLTTILVDETSHLNIARQTVDSLTPGISQIGYWPPLVHVLMAPFAYSDTLYRTGLAGAAVLVPMLALAVFFLYKLIVLITGRVSLGVGGALLLLTNPYMTYYASVPMMEVLFLAMLFGVAYFLAVWIRRGGVGNLLLVGIFVSLASLSRFEGLVLLPLVGFIVLFTLLERKKTFDEINALIIIFSFVGVVGLLSILSYGIIFGSSPLEFLSGSWSAVRQQEEQGLALPAKFDLMRSFDYLMHASYYILGQPFVLFALASALFLLLLAPRRDLLAILLVLLSPFLVVLISLFRGIAVVYVPELPPYGAYGDFFNERYGLLWIGFLVAAPMFLFGILGSWLSLSRWRVAGMVLPVVLLAAPLYMMGKVFYQVALVEKFRVVRASSLGYPTAFEAEVAEYIKNNYDYGKILMPRALNNYVAIKSGIPLKGYIHEANYRFYDQALTRPWLFARYVIMINQDSEQTTIITPWTKRNERISLTWGNSRTFLRYYTLVLENEGERVYKIREDAVRTYAVERGIDFDAIPSLNGHMAKWDPDNIYRDMGAAYLAYAWEPNEPLARGESLRGFAPQGGEISPTPKEEETPLPTHSLSVFPTRTARPTSSPQTPPRRSASPNPTSTRAPSSASSSQQESTSTFSPEPMSTISPSRFPESSDRGDQDGNGEDEGSNEGYESRQVQTTHIVKQGDSLWNIARRYYGNGGRWKRIAEENNLKKPDYLLPLTALVVPADLTEDFLKEVSRD